MPVFNDVRFIRQALDSLLDQSFRDFELIISDDQSTDGSEQVCQEYAARDPRIRYFRQPKNIGIQRNMEFLLHQSRGEFFMWAADDDRWDKNFISILLAALQKDQSLALAFCPYKCIDEQNKVIIGIKKRAVDFSGKKRFTRLVKFCYFYDDGCGYGLFRKNLIKEVHYPVWWGINRGTALNNIYPPIFYFLSAGQFKLVDTPSLWFNRIKRKSNHQTPFSGKVIFKYPAYLLRKINVLYESIISVYRGSRSIFLVLSVVPFVFGRFVFDCFLPVYWHFFPVRYSSSSEMVG
jgi:glycosyltransferase involved in cell wall biosynthesis